MKNYMIYLILFVIGAIIGSFINCFIWRARHGGSVWFGRSKCIHCHKHIWARDNVPLFGFLRLRGHCRFCHKEIPTFYFFVELTTAILFVLVGWLNNYYGSANTWFLIRDLFFVSILIVVFVYDLLYQIILPKVIWFGTTVGLFFNLLLLDFTWQNLMLAILVGGGFFLLQYLISNGRWIGGGDIRLGVMLGVWLLWPNVFLALFIAYITGAIFSLILIAKNKKYWRMTLPFGVFLAFGSFIAIFFGDLIINWYLGLLYG